MPKRHQSTITEPSDKRIGILLVHGIGDQQRHEHLQAVGESFVRALALRYGRGRVSVEMFPGHEDRCPLSIFVKETSGRTIFDLHELWWRDLGKRPAIKSTLQFWFWAISLPGTRGRFSYPQEGYANPSNECVKGNCITKLDRLQLFMRTTYFFFMLAPLAVVMAFVNLIPGVRRIQFLRTVFTYLSSVQMYLEDRTKQIGTLVDFDHPRRTSIQRKFMSGVIDMAERDYDSWFIVAHSLGSVIAFRGLMCDEISAARLVTSNRWNDPNFAKWRANFEARSSVQYPSRPRRPIWLSTESGVDLSKVFERFRGLVTYGSPLETFTRVWPALVQTRKNPPVNKNFEWVNIYDPIDIVSSELTSYGECLPDTKGTFKPKNFGCHSSWLMSSAHTSYFVLRRKRRDENLLLCLISWMMDGSKPVEASVGSSAAWRVGERRRWAKRFVAVAQGTSLLFLGALTWPMVILLLARSLSFTLPIFYFLGENARSFASKLLEDAANLPAYFFHLEWFSQLLTYLSE